MRWAVAQCLIKMLANQQDSVRKQALVQQIRTQLSGSSAFQMRKTFIFLCCTCVGSVQLSYYEENFFDSYLEMCGDKVP